MTDYLSLGVRRVINCDARLTALGGSLMPDVVVEAMNGATSAFVDIVELQDAVGAELARLTKNEAAYVCSGAAAGLALATLACRTGSDLTLIAGLPDSPAKKEVVIHNAHRTPYDPAIRLAGGRLVGIGNMLQSFAWELEAALNEATAAVLFVAGSHMARSALPLDETVSVAHAAGVPVIVDAAAQLPPPENLWRFTKDSGADLAVFSGGKALRGPQPSGLIVGRADLIRACATNGAPHQRLARAMKTGKEEMLGLLAAVKRYLSLDCRAMSAQHETVITACRDEIDAVPGLRATRVFPNEAGQPIPRLHVGIDPGIVGVGAVELRDQLRSGTPSIAVALADDHGLLLTPDLLQDGEAPIVVQQLRTAIAAVRARTVSQVAEAETTETG